MRLKIRCDGESTAVLQNFSEPNWAVGAISYREWAGGRSLVLVVAVSTRRRRTTAHVQCHRVTGRSGEEGSRSRTAEGQNAESPMQKPIS
jgi:hypothetical protein